MATNDHTNDSSKPVRYRYHTVDGDVHKGTQKDCPKCKGVLARKKRQLESQKRGRAGGLARQKGKQSYIKRVPCAGGCGKEIDSRNKTGMCIGCLRKASAALKKTGMDGVCRCCGGPARRDSVTGYCYKCYRESLHWQSRQKEHADWVSVNVCGKDAKTRQTKRT